MTSRSQRPRSSRASHTQSCRTARSKPRLPRSKSSWIRLWTRAPGTRSRWRRSQRHTAYPATLTRSRSTAARAARAFRRPDAAVASVMSCAKDGGVVAVYARYSEPGGQDGGRNAEQPRRRATRRLALAAIPPSKRNSSARTPDRAQPLWLEIPDGVTAQASGVAMVPGRLDSTTMQTSTTSDGCTVHKPLTVD